MNDHVAIQQTLNRYTEAASRADWDQAAATFLSDGIWEITALGKKFQGRAAIREALAGFVAPMDYMVQINAPGVIVIDGDTATVRSSIRECGKFSGKNEALEVLGHYADKLVRAPDGWKFAHRVFEVRGMHRFPLLPASA
jgi:ketosteroid isomerase-like protein